MKPYPLAPLNHFTVPFSLTNLLLSPQLQDNLSREPRDERRGCCFAGQFSRNKKGAGVQQVCCNPATGLFREVLTALYKNINPSPSPAFTGLLKCFLGS